jgi:hypothetical protein
VPPPAFSAHKPGNTLPEIFTQNPIDRESKVSKEKKKSQAVLRNILKKD